MSHKTVVFYDNSSDPTRPLWVKAKKQTLFLFLLVMGYCFNVCFFLPLKPFVESF